MSFELYRTAYDEMESNQAVLSTRAQIESLQEHLAELEAPYRERMGTAETAIKALVLNEKKPVTLHRVYAKYTRGARSTSWKSVATELRAPKKVIERYTKVGEPRVKVEVV